MTADRARNIAARKITWTTKHPAPRKNAPWDTYRYLQKKNMARFRQGCRCGSAWIRVHFSSLIRILILNADPDPGGINKANFYRKGVSKSKNVLFNLNYKNSCNSEHLFSIILRFYSSKSALDAVISKISNSNCCNNGKMNADPYPRF